MGYRRLLPVLAFAAPLLALAPLPPVAAQQPAGSTSPAAIEQARKHMEEGQSLYAQRRYLEAAQAFQRAYTAQPFAAFLFNEAVCYEKAGDPDKALATFKRYLAADPNPPDADSLKARIKRLEEQLNARKSQPDGAPPAPTPAPPDASPEAIHALLLFESNPPGAPAQIWQKADASAGPFRPGSDNKGWKLFSSGTTPFVATVTPGQYHLVTEKWRAYNRSDGSIEIPPGRFTQFRSQLSQGDFMGFLRVTSDVDGALVFLDDPPPHKNKPWGTTPHGELIPKGEHSIWVEAPGYETATESFSIDEGQQKQLRVSLDRLGYGILLVHGNTAPIKVFLDGEEQGEIKANDGPLRIKAPKGTHTLRATATGKKTYQGEVDVPAGQSRDVYVTLISKYSRATAWGAATTSALLFGSGIYFGLRSSSLHDGLLADRRAGTLSPDDQRKSQGKVFAIVANSSFAAGTLVAGFALYEFLRDPMPPSGAASDDPREFEPAETKPRRSSFLFAPSLSPSSGSLFFSGSF